MKGMMNSSRSRSRLWDSRMAQQPLSRAQYTHLIGETNGSATDPNLLEHSGTGRSRSEEIGSIKEDPNIGRMIQLDTQLSLQQ